MKTHFTQLKKMLPQYSKLTRLLFFICMFTAQASLAQYSVTNIGLSPTSPSTLTAGENVSITFNYTKATGDVRIFARPMYLGALASNYAAHGSPLYTLNSGAGTGSFTLTANGRADQIRIQIIHATSNAVLYETFVGIDYRFVNYQISNVILNPVSSTKLLTGENVNITFNYKAKGGNVRIFARPMKSGALASGYAAHGSPLYTASSGSATGFFTLTNPGDVDQIRFQIIDATSNAVLYTVYVPVTYKFVDFDISSVALSPVSPATKFTGDNINITFNYLAKGGNVRIFARPMKSGVLASGYAAHGSPVYTASSGNGTGSFTLTVPGDVDQVRFQIIDATTSAILFEYFVNVNYQFVNYNISNVSLNPVSPATILTGNNVSLTFKYMAKGGNVRIFARPMKSGALASGYAAHASSIYAAASGTGTGSFTLTIPGDVDQVRFQIIDATTSSVLYETFVSVNYRFADFNISDVSLNPNSPDTLTTGENVNITFKYLAKGGNVRIFARPMRGTALASGYAAHASSIYTTASGNGTGYFTLTTQGTVDKIRFQIVDATTNTVLYETFVAVNYRFLNYEISNLVKTPETPSTLTSGEHVNLTFNYRAKGGNVLIFARPMKSGALAPDYAAHPSPVYSASTGNGTGYFTLSSAGSVDKIRFQIVDATTGTVLYEKLFSVNYKFLDYAITDVSLAPSSSSILTTGENVNINFKYRAKGGNVRIFARPMLAGALATGYAAHASPLYTATNGNGTGYFTLTVPGKTDKIRFQIIDATTNVVLYETTVTGIYTFADYNISSVVLAPISPDTLTPGDLVNISFKYNAKGGNVRIFARPMTGSVLSAGYSASPSPLYTTPSGTGTGFFTLSVPGNVSRIRFQIIDASTDAVLYTKYVYVSYTFQSGIARESASFENVGNDNTNMNLSLVEVSPLPSHDYINIHHNQAESFSYQIYNTNGIMINEGKSESMDQRLDIQSYVPGMYILVIINGSEIIERKIIVQ